MTLDPLVIGAGPAGLQLGALLEADGRRDYLVVERADAPGAFFTRYPRHRRLISINKPRTGSDDPEVNLRFDWNSLLSDDPDLRFTRYTDRYFPDADVMVRYLADFAERSKVRVRYGAAVTRVSRRGGLFEVEVGGDTLTARSVVVATGVSLPYRAPIPGIELAEGYADMPVDPQDFLDQRVLVIGKGNSAFETADNLMETTTAIHVAGPESVRLAWRTHYVGNLRAVNNNFLDTYQLKSANAVLDGTVERIERDAEGYAVTFRFARAEETRVLRYHRVLACTGFAFDASVFDETCRPALAIGGRFPAQTDEWESVDVPGLFFAGTLMQQRDFRRSTSGFVHGFRYGVRALHHVLARRYAGEPWPSTPVGATPAEIAAAVVGRVNRTSALWQQFGVLADVVAVGDGQARLHAEGPGDLHARLGLGPDGHDEHAFVVTLEYGPDHDKVDPFDVTQHRVLQDAPGEAHDAAYLHPVVRHHRRGEHLATHHLAENLENRWDSPDGHVRPLETFLADALAGR